MVDDSLGGATVVVGGHVDAATLVQHDETVSEGLVGAEHPTAKSHGHTALLREVALVAPLVQQLGLGRGSILEQGDLLVQVFPLL